MVPHCSRIDSPALQAAFPSQSPLSAGRAGPRRAWPSGCNLRGPPPAPPGKRSPVTRSLLDRASSPRRVPGTRPFPPVFTLDARQGFSSPLKWRYNYPFRSLSDTFDLMLFEGSVGTMPGTRCVLRLQKYFY